MLRVFFSSVHLQEIYPLWNWDCNIVPISRARARLLSAKNSPNQALQTSFEMFLLNPTRDSSKTRWSKESNGCSVSHPPWPSVWERGKDLSSENDVVALLHICESEDKCRRWRDLEKDFIKGDRKQRILQGKKKKKGSWCQATISLFFLFVVALFRWLYSGHTCVFLHRNTHVYTVICNAPSPCLSPTIYFGSGGCWNFCSCA